MERTGASAACRVICRRASSTVILLAINNAVLTSSNQIGRSTGIQSRTYELVRSSRVGNPRRTTYALVSETNIMVIEVSPIASPSRTLRSRAP